jgi:2-dehydro-3-deoxyphosphogluconate aldolase/(4S)-4-hydroxy-2-oxoglutarate aldolase
MDEVLKRIGEIGIVPVVKIDSASNAVSLGKALLAGDLPVAEITFRTDAAEQAITNIVRELPQMLVGAGTILSVEQAKRALGAGARFIVSPGFNPKVVDYCVGKSVPVTPGVCSPTDIEMALERGLSVLKLFPAGASGGLDFLKAVAAPYSGARFIPTGGVDPSNLREYLAFNRVHAVGGTWIARDAAIAEGRFDEITKLAREAVAIAMGFEIAHVGINERDAKSAAAGAEELSGIFAFPLKDGATSIFVGSAFEVLKGPYLGSHGHIAIATLSIPRAVAYLERKGVKINAGSAKEKDGRLVAVYLEREYCGFAIHLLQR